MKLQVQQKNLVNDFETKMRLNGFKLKDRVTRVINKLFDKEIDLSDVFVRRSSGGTGGGDSEYNSDDNQPRQSHILKRTMLPVEEMCQAFNEFTHVEDPQPLLDQVEGGETKLTTWWESKRARALHETKKWIDRQHVTLKQHGIDIEETPLLDFESRNFKDENRDQKKHHLDRSLAEKFCTDDLNKMELKTSQVLLDEVVRQVRVWSGKHADLI